jgi:polyisoprenoid-binding protein YceI
MCAASCPGSKDGTHVKTSSEGRTRTQTLWQLDPAHTLIELSARHMMFTTIKGRLRSMRGRIVLDEADPSRSSVEAEIDAASLDTGVVSRDVHLQSPDFLDTVKYSMITFKSTRVEPQGAQRARVIGDLTIRDISREVVLDVHLTGVGKNPWGDEVVGFEAEATISRSDFAMTWNIPLEGGGFLVGDTFQVEIHAEAIKQREGDA